MPQNFRSKGTNEKNKGILGSAEIVDVRQTAALALGRGPDALVQVVKHQRVGRKPLENKKLLHRVWPSDKLFR